MRRPSKRVAIIGGGAALAVVLAGSGIWAYAQGHHGQAARSSAGLSPTGTIRPNSTGNDQQATPVSCPPATVLDATAPNPYDPSPRDASAVAYDPLRKELVLFGGYVAPGGTYFGDTWVMDGTSWKQLSPEANPQARAWASMTFDASHGVIVLFGGQSYGGNLNDTWTWDGTTWTQKNPGTSPLPSSEVPMDYDEALRSVVLLAGSNPMGGNPLTWLWNGDDWRVLPPSAGPPSISTTMAYDPATSSLVLFTRDRQTWSFDGVTWARRTHGGVEPYNVPGLSNMAYDASTRPLVLLGGGNPSDTWTWDGAAWSQPCPAAAPPMLTGTGPMPAMAYDPALQAIFLFGGWHQADVNQAWIWNGSNWLRWESKSMAPATASPSPSVSPRPSPTPPNSPLASATPSA